MGYTIFPKSQTMHCANLCITKICVIVSTPDRRQVWKQHEWMTPVHDFLYATQRSSSCYIFFVLLLSYNHVEGKIQKTRERTHTHTHTHTHTFVHSNKRWHAQILTDTNTNTSVKYAQLQCKLIHWAQWSSPLTLIYSQRFITPANERGEMAALRATPHSTTAVLQQITSSVPLTNTPMHTDWGGINNIFCHHQHLSSISVSSLSLKMYTCSLYFNPRVIMQHLLLINMENAVTGWLNWQLASEKVTSDAHPLHLPVITHRGNQQMKMQTEK